MNANQEKVIEKTIDFFKSNNNEYNLEAALMQFEDNFDERQFFVQQIIKTYKFVERKRSSNNFHLTENGIAFKGFEEMRNSERLNKEANDKLLWYNSENAKTVFEDYPNIKKRSNLTLAIAAASMILSVLLAIKSCSR